MADAYHHAGALMHGSGHAHESDRAYADNGNILAKLDIHVIKAGESRPHHVANHYGLCIGNIIGNVCKVHIPIFKVLVLGEHALAIGGLRS